MKIYYRLHGNKFHTFSTSSRGAMHLCVALSRVYEVQSFAVCDGPLIDEKNWSTLWNRSSDGYAVLTDRAQPYLEQIYSVLHHYGSMAHFKPSLV